MNRTLLLRRVALVFGSICVFMAGWYYIEAPKVLRVAVGPADSSQHRYVQAMARALKDTQQPYRFEIVTTTDSSAASLSLDQKQVDLAVLRSDDPASVEARSIAILQKRFILLVTRKDSGITSVGDLGERPVALLSPTSDKSLPVVGRILQHYGIRGVAIDEFVPKEFAETKKAFDAYLVIADPTSGSLRSIISAIADREKTQLTMIGLPAPEGLAQRLRELQKSSIPEGLFGGTPPNPPEELESVSVTYELTGSSRLSEADGSALLGKLVDLRTRMRRLMPRTTFDVEPPPVDTPRRFLPHSGAAAFVNDDAPESFLETYSDQIWLALFVVSIIGSSVTGFLGWAGVFDNPVSSQQVQRRISTIARQLAEPTGAIDLDQAQTEVDALMTAFLCSYGRAPRDPDTELSLALWTTALNNIIERKRALSRSQASALSQGSGHGAEPQGLHAVAGTR